MDNVNVQVKSTVMEALGNRKIMFMPMVCVSSFMLVGYAALDTEAPEILTETLELELNQDIDQSLINVVDNSDDRSALTVVVDQSAYDKSQEGTYTVTVTAADSFNNESTREITVINKDRKAPVFVLNEAGEGYSTDGNVLNVRYGSSGDIKNYVKAIDDNINSGNNGDLTAFINQENTLDTATLGARYVTVNVQDDAGNEARQIIPLYIIDDVAPELKLKDNGNAVLNYGSTFNLSDFAEAIDGYEGNLTSKIQILEGQAPNPNQLGATSTLKLAVEDSSGNRTEKSLTLTVKDIEAPTISFKDNNFRVEIQNGTLNVANYVTAHDNYDSDINSKVRYSSSTIDLSTKGDKEVTVSVTDAAGNSTSRTFGITVYDPADFVGSDVANLAWSRVGCSYVLGATGPYAFDCSGLAYWVYNNAGMPIPRSLSGQYANSTHIYSYSELQPGDLLFYSCEGWCSHVGIYVGNGMMVHAGYEAIGVVSTSIYSSYWTSRFVCGGRF